MERGKVILVTGSSSGIGRAIFEELADGKNTIILLAREEDKLKNVASQIKNSAYFVCDISDEKAVDKVVNGILKRFGKIDVLVNNAGIWIEGKLDENRTYDIRRTLEINTLGQIYMARAVIPTMKKQGEGLIINIISQAGLYGKAERTVYNASKFAMTGFTKSLELELRHFGVRVTGIYPGKVNTELFSKTGVTKKMEDSITTRDVAEAVAFVVSRPKTVCIPELGIKNIEN